MITQASPKAAQHSSEVVIFQSIHALLKTPKSLLVGHHRGPEQGYLEIQRGTPPSVRVLGYPFRRKKWNEAQGLDSRTVATIGQDGLAEKSNPGNP